MQKVKVKDNPLKLDVYINGIPNLDLIPKDLMNSAISTLAKEIVKLINEEKSKN